MFGYLRPLKSDEHEGFYFKAQYCTLCKTLSSEKGFFSRLLLSFDISTLGLFLRSFEKRDKKIYYDNCILHPIKKRQFFLKSEVDEFLSEITIFLGNEKLSDDIEDEKGFRKLRALFLRNAFVKAPAKKTKIFRAALKNLFELNYLENINDGDIDRQGILFGKTLGSLIYEGDFSFIKEIEKEVCAFTESLGRWLFWADAVDDLKKDLEKSRFNPLIRKYNLKKDKPEKIPEILKEEKWRGNLLLSHIQLLYLPLKKNMNYYSVEIDDIIFRSLPYMTAKVLRLDQNKSCKINNGGKNGRKSI